MTDFNVLTFNGRSFPGTAPLVAKYGDRVRIRFGNLSPMEHHPIHLHGFYWNITEMDGLQVPEAAQQLGNTVLVAVGQTRTVEFVADNPGDWAMHCHMTHHTMNQMGHNAARALQVLKGRFDFDQQDVKLPQADRSQNRCWLNHRAALRSGHR